ncbi:MAG: protease modulator HflC [Rhizobiales bacterium]|nr:protease modulator HflC [Hyphomicrobiales bacterium]
MSPLRTVLLIAGAAILFVAYLALFQVDQRQNALVLRFGDIYRTIEDPGLYGKVPVADTVIPIDVRLLLWESNDKIVQVADSRQYSVDAFTIAQVVNPRKFRETVGADYDIARAQVERRLDSALRQTYGKRAFDAALSKDRAVMMREIRDQVRAEAENLGVRIVDVRIRRTELQKDALTATYQRMESERLAEAKDLRGKGEAAKIRLMAEADRKVVEVVSEARRQGEILRGEGEAERNKVFAAAFERDPEFFSFYRSMQAYAKSMTGPGTNLVLSPNSEFFKYFGGDGKAKAGTATADQPAAKTETPTQTETQTQQ